MDCKNYPFRNLRTFFICIAITASVQGLPGITRYLEEEIYSESQRHNEGNIFQHEQDHLMQGKISIHEPSTVEFIHQGQNKTLEARKGTDQERYTYNSHSIAINNDKKYKPVIINQSDSIDSSTEILNTNEPIVSAALKTGTDSFMKIFLKKGEWLLNTNEASSNTRSLPKYFYGILPVSAFPGELLVPKETTVLKNEKLKNSGVLVPQKTSQPTHIAGPMPYPQSTYAREFDLPFFD